MWLSVDEDGDKGVRDFFWWCVGGAATWAGADREGADAENGAFS